MDHLTCSAFTILPDLILSFLVVTTPTKFYGNKRQKKGKKEKKERGKEKKKARLRKEQCENEEDVDPEVTGDTKGMRTVYRALCGGQGCQPPISPYSDFLQSAAKEDHSQVRTPASPRMV